MQLDWNIVVAVVGILNLVGALLFGALIWRMRGEFVGKDDHETLRQRVDSHEIKLAKLETRTQRMPTSADLHALAVAMERLGGEIGVAVERISGVKEDIDRIEETMNRHDDILSHAARGAKS